MHRSIRWTSAHHLHYDTVRVSTINNVRLENTHMPDQGFLRHQYRRAFSAWSLLFLALPLLLSATTLPATADHSNRQLCFCTPAIDVGCLAISEQKTSAAAAAPTAFSAPPLTEPALSLHDHLTQTPFPNDPVFALCTVLWQSPALPRPPPIA